MAKRWKQRPEGSNWGEFGDDDQIGRLNYLTPQKVLQGIAEVREGLSFCLSIPLDFPGGEAADASRRAPVLAPTMLGADPRFNKIMRPGMPDTLCDDVVLLTLQYSTQWDAFSHAGSMFDADGDGVPEMVYYNGYRAEEHIIGERDGRHVGALKLGIETFAEKAVQGRGVMIDLLPRFGGKRHAVTGEELLSVMREQNVAVEKGDMVCVRTGYADALLAMNRKPDHPALLNHPALAGRDPVLRQWVTESGLSCIFADNVAVEYVSTKGAESDPGSKAWLPLHELCLFKLGIPLGEMWQLGPLADWLGKRGRSRFLLTAPPLRLPRAVGSPATPVATV